METRRSIILTKHAVPISRLTTFQNSGDVAQLLVITSDTDLAAVAQLQEPYFVLGKGSNTVINPQGKYHTMVQVSPDYCKPVLKDGNVCVGAGLGVKAFLDFCIAEGLSGLEFAAGVPASIGGMAVMNFGCWGEEMASRVRRVKVWSPHQGIHWLTQEEMHFAYRRSVLQQQQGSIVLAVVLALTPGDGPSIQARVRDYVKSRSEKQPIREKTFGSTFKNPPGHFAAALIESVGLKGKVFGGLKISERHANFLVNTGHATFEDIQCCLETIQKTVYETQSISLELEVKLAT